MYDCAYRNEFQAQLNGTSLRWKTTSSQTNLKQNKILAMQQCKPKGGNGII